MRSCNVAIGAQRNCVTLRHTNPTKTQEKPMRKIHNIILDNIDNGERVKAIEIISKALSQEFGKSCAVLQDGHFSDCALDAIPPTVSIFVIGKPAGGDDKAIVIPSAQ
jgi:Fe-S cluster assembly ATPase SufC